MPQKIPLTTKLLDFARRVLFVFVLIHAYITQPAPTHLVPQTIWLFFQIGVGLGIFFVFFGKALEEYLLNEATFSSGLKNLTYALITNGAFVILIGQVGDPLAFVFQSYPGLATVFVVLALLGSFYAGFRISDFIGKAGGVWLIGKKHKRPTKPSAQDSQPPLPKGRGLKKQF